MTNKLRLTPAAKEDLKSIGRYTHQNFGVKQMENYLTKIDDGFTLIQSEPEIGITRDDIKKGYCAFAVEQHIIFYWVSNKQIDILGITSGKVDIKNYYPRILGTP